MLIQVTHLLGVLGFGAFCFVLGARKLTDLLFIANFSGVDAFEFGSVI